MSELHPTGWRRPPQVHTGRVLGRSVSNVIVRAPRVDFRAKAPPVSDQRRTQSCVGHATRYAAGVLCARDGLDLVPAALASYYDARDALHETGLDAGALLADALAGAEHRGLVDERAWPDEDARVLLPPDATARAIATHTRLIDWEPLGHDAGTILGTLRYGLPIVFGVLVYPPLDTVGSDGRVAMPSRGQTSRGGHALCAVGYDAHDLTDIRLIVPGSWGLKYGDHGFIYLPLDYVLDAYLCGEIHALHDVRHLA